MPVNLFGAFGATMLRASAIIDGLYSACGILKALGAIPKRPPPPKVGKVGHNGGMTGGGVLGVTLFPPVGGKAGGNLGGLGVGVIGVKTSAVLVVILYVGFVGCNVIGVMRSGVFMAGVEIALWVVFGCSMALGRRSSRTLIAGLSFSLEMELMACNSLSFGSTGLKPNLGAKTANLGPYSAPVSAFVTVSPIVWVIESAGIPNSIFPGAMSGISIAAS